MWRLPNLKPETVFCDRKWVAEDGLKLYARDYAGASGTAQLPVIALHGLTRNSADFAEVAPYMAATGRRVLVPDVRGRGRSDYDPQPLNYHLWTYAKDVLALCDALGIMGAHFVGTSMGGLILMVMSTLRPTLIRGVILNDVGPTLSPKGLARIAGYAGQSDGVYASLKEAVAYTRSINGSAFPNLGPKDWEAFAKRLFVQKADGRWHLDYDPRIADAFKATTVTPQAFDMAPLYMSLATGRRVLLVRGALSDLMEEDQVRLMQPLSPDFTRIDVEGVGHAPLLTEPEAKAAILGFLKEMP